MPSRKDELPPELSVLPQKNGKVDEMPTRSAKGESLETLPPDFDAGRLLEDIAHFVSRYVVLSEEQADVIALWVVHTHAFDAAETTPYINITSAEKRSGKSRLLEVSDTLVARSWLVSRVTAAVLVRKVAALTPTLLLDETDAAFKGDKEYSEALRGILNAGFRRGGVASLCVGQGADLSWRDFPVFCPKAIAGIGKLPDTISDRCIRIELKRRSRSEPVERFRPRKVEPEASDLREKAAAWAAAHTSTLTGMEPDLPEELDDRAQDITEPLLAIADLVGGEWPERARKAVVVLASSEVREDSDSLGVRLLRDLKQVFEEHRTDKLSTNTILNALNHKDDAPWGALKGDALNARFMARLLKPYGVGPKQICEGESTPRGYLREDFEDAWERYARDPDEGDSPSSPLRSKTAKQNPQIPLIERNPVFWIEFRKQNMFWIKTARIRIGMRMFWMFWIKGGMGARTRFCPPANPKMTPAPRTR